MGFGSQQLGRLGKWDFLVCKDSPEALAVRRVAGRFREDQMDPSDRTDREDLHSSLPALRQSHGIAHRQERQKHRKAVLRLFSLP